jgi:hypothetical protein
VALKVRIDPVERVTTANLLKTLSEPEQRQAAAALARSGIEEAKQTNRSVLGRIPPHVTTVDGRRGAPLESVRPDGGQIVTEFELVGDVLKWIANELAERSPVRKGDYLRGHKVFADGVEIDVSAVIPDADEYIFTNVVPYARKIEIGKTRSGRAFVIQVAPRIYEVVAQAARRRFGNIIRVRYSFRDIRAGRQSSRAPAIIITSR